MKQELFYAIRKIFKLQNTDYLEIEHNTFADDLHMIRIRTKSGLQFHVIYYPNYGFLYSSHAMAYHQVTPELKSWLQEDMGIE